jgi:hypothetical protein
MATGLLASVHDPEFEVLVVASSNIDLGEHG